MKKLKSRIKDIRLGSKLLITYVLFAVLPILVVGSIICLVSFRVILNQTKQYAAAMIENINKEIDLEIESMERQSYYFYSDQEVQEILTNLDRYSYKEFNDKSDIVHRKLIGLWVNNKNIVGTYLCGKDGHVFANSINENAHQIKSDIFEKEDWYERIRAGSKQGILTGTYKSSQYAELDGFDIISYIHGVSDTETGAYLGFLVLDFDASFLEYIVGGQTEALEGEILILDRNRKAMFASADRFDTEKNTDAVVLSDRSEKTGWTVEIKIPEKALTREISRILLMTVLTGSGCLFVFIGFSKKIADSISRPIRRMSAGMKEVGKGNFDIRLKIERGDEVGTLAAGFNEMLDKTEQLIKQVYIADLNRKEAEFNALQSQINPHFIFNTLESVNMLAILEGNFQISDILTAFGRMLRANLDRSQNIVTLEQEMDYAKNYLLIMRLRDEELFSYQIEIEEGVKTCLLPKLTLQPIVENCLIHGFQDKLKLRSIRIRAGLNAENVLEVEITDDGKGIKKEKLEQLRAALKLDPLKQEGSIGISNVYKRCEFFFGKDFEMKILSEYGVGTSIKMRMKAVYETDRYERKEA